MNSQRREFLAILGICAASTGEVFAQHNHLLETAPLDFTTYQPKAFSPSEYQLLDQLLETLLPADETGPGAHDAHVAYYIDVVLSHGPAGTLHSWKNGLAGVDAIAGQFFKQRFQACSDPERRKVVAELAGSEMAPRGEMDRFFVELKRMAMIGFYASELIQRDHLGYRGNTAVSEFAGCTHSNFEHPDLA